MLLRTLISFTLSIVMMPKAQGFDQDFVFSRNIASNQLTTLQNDLRRLEVFPFSHTADEKTLQLMGLNDLNAHSASNWLKKRVTAVVEDIDTNRLSFTARPYNHYPQTSAPTIESAISRPRNGESAPGVTVMSNIGTAIYHAGKSAEVMYTLKIRTGFFSNKSILIDSPRAGVIKIGEGLFKRRYQINKTNDAATSNTIGRMAVFFHEARHSDGNGSSLGFFHAVCPIGHDFEGVHACDRNLNGPYSIGAQMIKEFSKNCDDCSASEKEQLRLRYLDSINRVLTSTPTIKNGISDEVDRAQAIHKSQRMLYEMRTNAGQTTQQDYLNIVNSEKELMQLAHEHDAIETIPSKSWNDQPEQAGN